MNVLLIAVIILAVYFIGDTFISKISIIGSVPGKGWTLGMGWFVILVLINLAIVIFIPVYYYSHDDTGKMGAAGNTGKRGIYGAPNENCFDCSISI
jgi:hypothetical protein